MKRRIEPDVGAGSCESIPGRHLLGLVDAYRERGIDVEASLAAFGLQPASIDLDSSLDPRRAAAWIEHTLATSRQLEARCEALLSQMRATGRVAAELRSLITADPVRFSSFDTAADALRMSPRSLRRRLLEERTAFSAILHDVRMRLGADYLRTTRLPIGEIALRLGYSEEAAFSRAFKRSFARTPRASRSDQAPAGATRPDAAETAGRPADQPSVQA
ncbi:MAG TPA: helix-turn-helix transcriptional regulator [Burkholderiaceae bacterium]